MTALADMLRTAQGWACVGDEAQLRESGHLDWNVMGMASDYGHIQR